MTAAELSRRRVLRLAGAGTLVTAAGGVGLAGSILTSPSGANDPPTLDGSERPEGFLAVPARITEIVEGSVRVEPLESHPDAEEWDLIPAFGFPPGGEPRIGDHVTVGEAVDGEGLVAAPLCRWVEGIPASTSNEGFAVAERFTVPAAQMDLESRVALQGAAADGTSVAACLLDTSLETSVVLQVRITPPPPPPPAG